MWVEKRPDLIPSKQMSNYGMALKSLTATSPSKYQPTHLDASRRVVKIERDTFQG